MPDFFSVYTNSNQYDNPLKDRYNRDRYYNSFNGDIFTPVLSKQIQQEGFVPHYPGNKKFAVCISHDIDHLFNQQAFTRKIINTTKHFLKGRFNGAYSSLKSIVKEEIAPQNSLKTLREINNAFHVKSSYYFLSLDKGEEDYNYSVENIKNEFDAVLSDSCEIGLHGGHTAYNNLDKILSEKSKLEASCTSKLKGYRNHYLRFQLPVTWKNIANAGFLYDTTFGYADCIGFRNGMCYPFYPYDAVKNEFIDIIELPLIVMDATLFYYMRFDKSASLKICRKIIEEVKNCQGVFTLLWHNNFIGGEMGDTYKAILELLNEYDPWFATSSDIVEWWKKEQLIEKSQNIVQKLMLK